MKGGESVTDERIVALLREKNETALAEIKAKYQKRCVLLASRICSKEDGEEIFSDALMTVFKNADAVTGENLFPYLSRTVRNLALKKREYLTAKKRGGTDADVPYEEDLFPSGENVSSFSPESLAEMKETAEFISRYLKGISPDARMIFVCRCYFGMSVEGTAKHLKISESKVKTSLSRTRKDLKNHLERNGLL